MTPRVLVLGAGFGGLELTSILSDEFGDELDLTLVDRSDHFVFGFSKLDVMFGHATPEGVRLPYSSIVKPGVQFRKESISAIDPIARRVRTDAGSYEADILVIALGADYDLAATPGLAEGGNEFYSVAGATRLRDVIPTFSHGHAVVGVTSTPFKCPPAPSEAALLLHDDLTRRRVRDACSISLVMPFGTPIPPAPDASRVLMGAFAERGITFVPDRLVRELDPGRHMLVLDDGSELPYDLFLGIPKHRVPDVVAASGMTEDGWIPVDRGTLMTKFPGVFAIGDVNSVGTPKAGVFSEGAGRVVAEILTAQFRGAPPPPPYGGAGSCYIEFGAGAVGRVDVNFLSGPSPTGAYLGASTALVAEKKEFGADRRRRWFGLP